VPPLLPLPPRRGRRGGRPAARRGDGGRPGGGAARRRVAPLRVPVRRRRAPRVTGGHGAAARDARAPCPERGVATPAAEAHAHRV